MKAASHCVLEQTVAPYLAILLWRTAAITFCQIKLWSSQSIVSKWEMSGEECITRVTVKQHAMRIMQLRFLENPFGFFLLFCAFLLLQNRIAFYKCFLLSSVCFHCAWCSVSYRQVWILLCSFAIFTSFTVSLAPILVYCPPGLPSVFIPFPTILYIILYINLKCNIYIPNDVNHSTCGDCIAHSRYVFISW